MDRHHRARTHGRWRYQRLPDGTYDWTSPHGEAYLVAGPATLHLLDHEAPGGIDAQVSVGTPSVAKMQGSGTQKEGTASHGWLRDCTS